MKQTTKGFSYKIIRDFHWACISAYSGLFYHIWYICCLLVNIFTYLKPTCYSCSFPFQLHHRISYINGGLVIAHQNKVHDELLYIAWRAFPYNCVCVKNLIHQGRSRSEEGLHHGRGGLDTSGEVIIWGLWKNQTDAIINVRFVYADADTYKNHRMDKLLDLWEKKNKDKKGNNCHEQHSFYPFYLSVENMIGIRL